MSRSRPRGRGLDLSLNGEISEIAGYAINRTSQLHCAVPPLTERKRREASLWSHCSFLRDTVAATVQLARPGIWLAAGSFSQMPVAFQLGTKRNSFAKVFGKCLKEIKCLCGALKWWITLDYFAPSALPRMLINHLHNKDELWLLPLNLFAVSTNDLVRDISCAKDLLHLHMRFFFFFKLKIR